jgi:uncharacterized protein
VAAFGAFVDVGVHQDGLVHVSAMSRTFVSDPHTVVKSGDVVRVKVLSVDAARKRISLTLRLDDEGPRQAGGRERAQDRPARPSAPARRTASGPSGQAAPRDGGQGALADALRRAGLVRDDDGPGRR